MANSDHGHLISKFTPSDWGTIIGILMLKTRTQSFDINIADMEQVVASGNGVRIEVYNDRFHFRLITPTEVREYLDKNPDTTVFGNLPTPPTSH